MAKFVMVVQSQALDGRDDDYNAWYDGQHFHDICAIPGVISGRRLEATGVGMGEPGLKYLALYEIEAEDAGAFMAAMGQHGAAGKMPGTDAIDMANVKLWIYQVSDKYL